MKNLVVEIRCFLILSIFLLPWALSAQQANEGIHERMICAPRSPASFSGKVKDNTFATQKDIVHVLSWEPSPDRTVAGYRIYRGSHLIKTTNKKTRQALFHGCRKSINSKYKLVAFNQEGIESNPLFLKIGKLKSNKTTSPTLTFSTTTIDPIGGSNGSIIFHIPGGECGFQFSINGGKTFQTSNVFAGLSIGTYDLAVKDNNCKSQCTITGKATLVDPHVAITFTTAVVNNLCYGSSNGSITFNASGGEGLLSYSIDGGQSFQSTHTFADLRAGIYNLVVKDANDDVKTGTANLIDPPSINFTIAIINNTCPGNALASITFNASGGTGALSYSINGGTSFQPSETFTGLTAGTYSLVVKDGNGCTKEGSAQLIDPNPISFTTAIISNLCHGGSQASIAFNASGGTGTFSYSIDGGKSFQASNTFSGLTAGTYGLVVKDANGCTKTANALLIDPPAISFSTTIVNNPCNGDSQGSITFNASGGTGVLFYSINGGASLQTSSTFTGLSAGTYNLVVKDSNGCIEENSVILTDPAQLTFTSTLLNPTRLDNGSITINATGGTGDLVYSIDGGETFQVSPIFSGLSAGTYNLVVMDQALVMTFSGSLGTGDLIQNGLLNRNNVTSTCSTPKIFPGIVDSTSRLYKSGLFTNPYNSPICVFIDTSDTCSSTAFTTIYSPSFDSTNIANDYLADPGFSGLSKFSFSIEASSSFTVVVTEVFPFGSCSDFTDHIIIPGINHCSAADTVELQRLDFLEESY